MQEPPLTQQLPERGGSPEARGFSCRRSSVTAETTKVRASTTSAAAGWSRLTTKPATAEPTRTAS